jgi:transcription elongation GreA/GreB family factor
MKKTLIKEYCITKLQTQKQELQAAIEKVFDSIVEEDKSTAGNKYETARALGQEELDRLHRQVNSTEQQIALLSQLDANVNHSEIQTGALVKTTDKYIYFAIAIGRIQLDGNNIFVISVNSPMGQKAKGLKKGDFIELASGKEEILEVI